MYLHGTTTLPDVNDGELFHYTKFESFKNIIKTMTLKSSPLRKMNDLNEASVRFLDWTKDFLLMYDAEEYIKKNCSVLCFTKNYMEGGICQSGGNHPALWAHYAENSNGVCIVLNETAVIENNKELLSQYFHALEEVNYTHNCSPDDTILGQEYSNVSEFLQQNYKELFFKKHVDWSYERETRLLVESPEVSLNIDGAIEYIILGGRMKNDEKKINEVSELIRSLNPNFKGGLHQHFFAQASPSPYGYSIDIASYLIK